MNEVFRRIWELYLKDYIFFTPEQQEEVGGDIRKYLLAATVEAKGKGITLTFSDITPDWLITLFNSYVPQLRKEDIITLLN